MSRWARHGLMVIGGLMLLELVVRMGPGLPNSVFAQEEAPAAAAPAAGGEHAAEGEGHAAPKSTLMWLIHTSGWIGAVLLVISIYFVALTVQLFMEMRPEVVMPEQQIQEWDAMLAKRDYQGIYRSAKEQTSEIAQLVSVGMLNLSSGLGEAREAIDRQGEMMAVQMEKRISMLAVIGSLGPMIGLLGTLKGMISSFSVIAISGTQLKASEVAGGISEALLITFEGVALSVPAIYFFAVFKNRVSVLTVTAINTADEFIKRVYASSQTKQPAA